MLSRKNYNNMVVAVQVSLGFISSLKYPLMFHTIGLKTTASLTIFFTQRKQF